MAEPMNPVDIEARISETANRIANGVTVCSNAYADYLDADRAYDLAFARAYMAHEGPAHGKRYAAEIDTAGEREVRDRADVVYRHADRTAKALQDELRALQSVGASIRTTYSVAGVGER